MQQINPQDMRARVNQLLSNEIDRKDFIKYLGVGIVAMTGVYSAIKAVGQLSSSNSGSAKSVASGYGASSYGGRRTVG